MKLKIIVFSVIILTSCISNGQINLVREGITINNSTTGSWTGDVISRTVKTNLTYQNNSITSVNTEGYMILAGDEGPAITNNNLDGAIFTGNKFVWNGVNGSSVITHGVFTGYNKNLVVKYNYLENVPYGIIFKSGTNEGSNMTFTSGGCSYNICKNGKFGVRLKGMNGLKIYNNTFYSGDNAGWYLVLVTANSDRTIPAPSLGTEIYNNIFFSTSKIPMIAIEEASLTNFSCDYNIYWCSAGEPYFSVGGKTITWAQWQAKGFDLHSKVVDPGFINTIDFVPANRLDFGKDLGTEWQTGLSITAKWQVGVSPAKTNQNGKWQVGAKLHAAPTATQINISSSTGKTVIDNQGGSLQLTAEVLPAEVLDKSVTWSLVNGSNLARINSTGLITAIADGTITVRATANDGSGIYGELNITISNQQVLIQEIAIVDNLSNDTIKGINKKLALGATITPNNATNKTIEWTVENLTGKATIDGNGVLTTLALGKIKVRVNTLDGSLKYSEKQYIIAIPTFTELRSVSNLFKIYPNPSNGNFNIELNKTIEQETWIEIIDLLGNIVYKSQLLTSPQNIKVPHLANNIYFIMFKNKEFSQAEKIILNTIEY